MSKKDILITGGGTWLVGLTIMGIALSTESVYYSYFLVAFWVIAALGIISIIGVFIRGGRRK